MNRDFGETCRLVYTAELKHLVMALKIKKALLFPDELQNSETIEAAINQHFTHLHGVLQNVERRLIDKLYEHRNYTTSNLNDIQQKLNTQEEQVQTGLLMIAAVNDLSSRVSLKDVIAKLEKLADVPCHLVEDPIAVQEKIMFSRESSIIEMLENHCKLSLPEVAGYNLLTTDSLPTDYELEPLAIEDLHKSETFSLDTSLIRSTSCQSLTTSRRPETPSLKQNGFNFVHICYVDSPSNFYVRLACHRQNVVEMETQLASYLELKTRPPQIVEQNKIYALKRGNRWCRGRVNAINTSQGSADTYEVFHLDFGRTENRVSKSRLRSIPDEMAATPQTVINCALYDIVPKDGIWGSPARKFMTDFFKLKEGRPIAMYMCIVKTKENTYLVDICKDPTRGDEGRYISVRDSLIFEGYGTFVTSQQLLRTTPQSVRRFFREDFNLNTFYDVKCSHVESPNAVFVQKAGDNLVFLAELINNMSEIYEEISKTPKWIIHVPEKGMPCAVQKVPGLWCRGLVNDIPAPQTVEIRLIDFGSKVTTNYEKIRNLHEKFMIGAGQAIKVTLADVEPINGVQWSEQAIEFTKNYITDNYARVVAFEKNEFGYKVALYINEVTNFAALLANSSYAVSTGPRSSGVVDVPNNQSNPKPQKSKVRNSRTCKTKKNKKRQIPDDNQNGFAVASTTETTEIVDPFRVQIKIIRVESPDVIFVADPTHEQKYNEMMDQMQKFYNKNRGNSDKSKWKVDYPCVVYSIQDRLFCRGKIVAINSPDEAEVFLCDLAFTIKVSINDVQDLEKKFWRTKYYAFKVKLAGISPCGGSSVWPLTSCDKLKAIIYENTYSKFYITRVINPDEDDLCVELWVEQGKIEGPLSPVIIEVKSINWMLVDAGLALPIKRYNEKTKVLAIDLIKQISNTEKEQRDESYKFIEYGRLVESDGDSVRTDSSSSKTSSALSERTLVSNEEIPTSWLPAEKIVDDTFIAKPSSVDYDCCVYVYSVTQNGNMLRSIDENLNNIYAKTTAKPNDLVWQEGDLCIAQYHSDKKWYRGQVRLINSDGISVEFIDYGNVEICESGTLRKSLALTHIPRQCTKCVIHGLYPNTPTHKWRIHDLDKIHSLIVDKDCEISVKKRKADHLEVEIVMLNPVRRELVRYIVKELRMDVLVDYSETDCSETEIETTIDNSDDVIIDGYIKTNETIENRDFSEEGNKKKSIFPKTKIIENQQENFVVEKSIENSKENSIEEKIIANITQFSDVDKSTVKSEKNCIIEKFIEENENDDSIEKSIKFKKDDNVKLTQDIKNDNFNIKNAVKEFNDKLNNRETKNDVKDDLNIKSIEKNEDLEVFETYEKKSGNESQIYETDVENNDDNGSTIIAEFPTNVKTSQLKKMNFSKHYDDFSTNNNTANLTYYDEDDVLSGTPNFTRIAGEIELNEEEAIERLETISLPDNYFMKEDELVASTPLNDSMECASYNIYKPIVFPSDVKVVKAEVAVVGPDVSWLHLLDNGNSKVVTKNREKYERIIANMQKYAEKQPRLPKTFGKGTPCCVKYTDGLWYRCSIIDSDSSTQTVNDIVRVSFVDWGNFDDVKFGKLRTMKEEWLDAPCLSLPCRLWGVEIASDVVPEIFMKKLWEAYGGNVTRAKPVYVEIKNFHSQIYEVQIYIDEECTQFVYDSLINEGLFTQNIDQESD